MSDEDPLVNGQPLSSLRVVDLKEELDKHGLSKLGNKGALAERLRNFIGGVPCTPCKEKSVSPTKSPQSGNPLVAEYLAKQQAALEASKKELTARRDSESEDGMITPTNSPHKTKPSSKSVDITPSSTEKKSSPRSTEKEELIEDPTTPIVRIAAGGDAKVASPAPKDPSPEPEPARDASASVSPEPSDKSSVSPAQDTDENTMDTSEKNEDTNDGDSAKGDGVSPAQQSPKSSVSPSPVEHVPVVVAETASQPSKDEVSLSAKDDPPKHIEQTLDVGADEELDYDEADDVKEESDGAKAEPTDEVMEDVDESTISKSLKPHDDVKPAPVKSTDKEEPRHSRSTGDSARGVSPSRHPESNVVHVRGLVRPFTIPALKTELEKHGGKIIEFWIDNIRSHCFVQMHSSDEARAVRTAMHNTHWPSSNPKTLSVQFDTKDNMDKHRDGKPATSAPSEKVGAAPAPVRATISTTSEKGERDRERPIIGQLPGRNGLKVTVEAALRENQKRADGDKERVSREVHREERKRDADVTTDDRVPAAKRHRSETPPFSRAVVEKKRERRVTENEPKVEEAQIKTADALFQKTKAQPSIYYQPLEEEEAVARATKKEADKLKEKERRR